MESARTKSDAQEILELIKNQVEEASSLRI